MRFGPDGVRGRAHSELTEAMASDLGRAIARVFFGTPVVIGGDSRESTPAFITAVSQGLIDGGSEVESLGMVPTPVVARSRPMAAPNHPPLLMPFLASPHAQGNDQ